MRAGLRTASVGAAAVLALSIGQDVSADITGTIDATITLASGCVINGANTANGASATDFGTLNFGTHTTLFSSADSQVAGGVSGVEEQCTAGVAPRLVFQNGLHDGQGSGAGNRALGNGSGGYVTYNLFLDAGYATPIAIGGGVTLAANGSPQNVAVYGRAYGASGLPVGTYNDVITVLLEL